MPGKRTKSIRAATSLEAVYILPMLESFQAEVYHEEIVRLSLMREDVPVSKSLRGCFIANTLMVYMAELLYILTLNIEIRAHYDSDMGLGAGIMINY